MKTLYTTPTADVFHLEGGILKEVWTVPILTDPNLIKEHLNITKQYSSEGGFTLILVDGSTTKKMAKPVRDLLFAHYESEEYRPDGLAILAKSAIARTIGTMILAFKRFNFKVKLFSDEQKAVDWLLEQKNK